MQLYASVSFQFSRRIEKLWDPTKKHAEITDKKKIVLIWGVMFFENDTKKSSQKYWGKYSTFMQRKYFLYKNKIQLKATIHF